MNIEEYILSGVVEAYVLGIATPDEVREIEQLMETYPELKVAVREQEEVLIKYAHQNAVAPPPQLKQNIWEALSGEANNEAEPTVTAATPHVPLTFAAPQKSSWIKYGLAASLALLIISIIGNVYQTQTSKQLFAEIAAANEQKNAAEKERNEALATIEKVNADLQVLALPKLVKINLAGVGSHTDMAGMLYWDGATGDVFVDLNKMPAAPAGKQYQLWAIVDGKPVDAGMYETGTIVSIHKMKTIPKAEMFAVTIEKAGGSPAPTLDQMVVAGKTS